MFLELTQLLGIKKTRITLLRSQSIGQVERQHQTLLNYLAKFVSEKLEIVGFIWVCWHTDLNVRLPVSLFLDCV